MSGKHVRRILLIPALIVLAVSMVLLLNFTAPNPTGRRYSSQNPVEVAAEQRINSWQAAERILAADLGQPNNNASGQGQCFCGRQYEEEPPRTCNTCTVVSPQINSYSKPDFITDAYIADSKLVQKLVMNRQLRDFLDAASRLERPLYIYVATGDASEVAPDIARQVAATGGAVVPYFVVSADYVDPVDRVALIALIVAGAFVGLVLVLEGRQVVRGWQHPEPEEPPRSDRVIHPRPLDDAVRAAEEAEEFQRRTRERVEIEIDIEDSHED